MVKIAVGEVVKRRQKIQTAKIAEQKRNGEIRVLPAAVLKKV
jgi:hypothetical protein